MGIDSRLGLTSPLTPKTCQDFSANYTLQLLSGSRLEGGFVI